MPRGLAYFLLSICLSNCALLSTSTETNQAELIPMASPIAPARRIVQQLTAIWPNHQESLLCVLELDSRHIAVAGLSSDGISLFNLSYDGKIVKLDKSPLLPDSFSPELIIKDLQLVYWPLAEMNKILPRHWGLEADKQHRRLTFNSERWVDVVYLQPDGLWPKAVTLTNHHYHYQLHIKTISYDTVPE
jgi:hypothetical protein